MRPKIVGSRLHDLGPGALRRERSPLTASRWITSVDSESLGQFAECLLVVSRGIEGKNAGRNREGSSSRTLADKTDLEFLDRLHRFITFVISSFEMNFIALLRIQII
jgi:hypothetical protein